MYKDLFEVLRIHVGCDYISDLQYGENNRSAKEFMTTVDLSQCPSVKSNKFWQISGEDYVEKPLIQERLRIHTAFSYPPRYCCGQPAC